MAKVVAQFRIAVVFALAMCVGPLHAQQSPAGQTGSTDTTQEPAAQTTIAEPTIPPSTESEPAPPPRSQEVTALDSSGVIALNAIRRARLLVGGTVSGGFDSNPNNSASGSNSTLYTLSPYVGFQASTPKTQYVVQYHPMISQSSGFTQNTMHVASLKVVSSVTERWNWTLSMLGNHGQDSLRLLATGGGQNVSSYLPNAGVETNLDTGFDLHYRASARDTWTLHLEDTYDSLPALHQTGSVASSTVYYDHSMRQSLGIVGYAQVAQYFGDLACKTLGGGAGVVWHTGERTLLSLSGGPQLNSPGCKRQQGFSYSASLNRKLLRKSQLYALANREPVAGNLGAGLWQDNVSAGYQRQLFRANTITLDLGYVHSSTLVNIANYHGTFYDASYSRQLHAGLYFACTFRSFMGDTSGTAFSRDTLIAQLTFTPNSRPLAR